MPRIEDPPTGWRAPTLGRPASWSTTPWSSTRVSMPNGRPNGRRQLRSCISLLRQRGLSEGEVRYLSKDTVWPYSLEAPSS